MRFKLQVFKRDDKRDFRLLQNLIMGEADFNQFMRLRNQLLVATENFDKEENLSPVLIPLLSKDVDEELKLTHNLIDKKDGANKNTCVTLLWYNVDKPEKSNAEVRNFPCKKVERKFQQLFMWTINFKNLSICLAYWILFMIKI